MKPETFGSISRFRLHGGLVMVAKPRPGSGLVATQLWLEAGSAGDPPGKGGLAHLLEHMVFKGNNGERFSRFVEEAGGEANAWTSYDETVFHMQVPKEGFIPALDALLAAVFHPGFDQADVDREKQVIVEEINSVRDSPERWLGDLLFAETFGNHPYGRNILGDPEQLSSIGPATLAEFHSKWYRPSNMVLAVVGDADIVAVARHVSRYLRGMKKAGQARRPASNSAAAGARPRARVVGGDVGQAYFMLGWPVAGFLHSDTPALELLASVLGAGESARLVEQLRDGAALVSDVYAYLHAGLQGGVFVIGGSCKPSKLPRVMRALGQQVAQLRGSVAEDELARMKAVMEADNLYLLESAEGEARKITAGQILAGDPRHADVQLRRLLALDGESLAAVATRYLVPERLSLVVMVPQGRAAGLDGSRLHEIFGAAVRKQPAAKKAPRRVLRRFEMKGGPLLVVERDPSARSIAVQAGMVGGLRMENEQDNGISNLVAHLLTRGTSRLDAGQLRRQLDEMGAVLEGYAGRNSIGIRAEAPARHGERLLRLLCECLVAPAFEKDELVRARRQVLGEIKAREDDAASVAFDVLLDKMYPRHPYRLPLLGRRQSVLKIGRERVVEFWSELFSPQRLVVAVAGNVDIDMARKVVARHCRPAGKVARVKPARPSVPLDPLPSGPVVVTRNRNRRQVNVVVGFRGTRVHSEERYPLEVLMALLTGQQGRLYQELRERRGLVYSVSGFAFEGIEPGFISFHLACDPSKVEEVLARVRDILGEAGRRKPARDELARAKSYLIGTYLSAMQRPVSRAAEILYSELFGMAGEWKRYKSRIRSVSAGDVVRVAAKYLRFDRSVTALVGPVGRGARTRLPK